MITYRVCLRMANATPAPWEIHSVGAVGPKSFLDANRKTGQFYKSAVEPYQRLALGGIR